jgi:hypothetical protein
MRQPNRSDLHIDRLLSDLSIGFMNEPGAYVADVVFPVVSVGKQSDKYARYKKDFWFRDEAKSRAPLTEGTGGGYGLDTPGTFFCDEWEFHKDNADEDRDNQDEVFDLDSEAAMYCIEKIRLSRERRFADLYFKTGVWATSLKGQTDTPSTNEFKCWDLSGSTPITDVENAKSLVKIATGINPNTLVVSEMVHQKLKNHSEIVDRFKYTQAGVITEQLLAKVFEVERYVVARAVYATSAEGDTAALTFALDKYGALLVYAAPKPGKWTPSGGYTFRWSRPMIGGISGDRLAVTVRKFRLDTLRADRVQASAYEDIKLIANECGVWFNDAIADGRTITS